MPPHAPLQQSPSVLQSCPSARHGAEHTGIPCESGVHVPRQQSTSAVQGLDVSRQLPGPRSQRPIATSHTLEQHAPEASAPQPSPLGRQGVGGNAQRPPLHHPEQQLPSSAHALPTTLHSEPPHWPPLQASAQQSCASSHEEPSGLQNGPQEREPRGVGSHRSLQHSVLLAHRAPGAAQVPDGRQ